jgi:hypothetical protein
VRLNYNVLGQNTLDDSYFGPLTHILTTTSLSEVPIAETWGTRYATYPKAGPALSSINPYRLLKVSGHFGSQSRIANPAVADEELRKVTVVETYWKDALPAAISTLLKDPPAPISTSASRSKRRLPVADAGVCTAGGPPVRVVRAGPSGCEGHAHRHEFSAGVRGRPYQLFGARVDAESRADGGGAVYDPAGKHPFRLYAWSVQEGVVLKEWSWRGSKWGAE